MELGKNRIVFPGYRESQFGLLYLLSLNWGIGILFDSYPRASVFKCLNHKVLDLGKYSKLNPKIFQCGFEQRR